MLAFWRTIDFPFFSLFCLLPFSFILSGGLKNFWYRWCCGLQFFPPLNTYVVFCSNCIMHHHFCIPDMFIFLVVTKSKLACLTWVIGNPDYSWYGFHASPLILTFQLCWDKIHFFWGNQWFDFLVPWINKYCSDLLKQRIKLQADVSSIDKPFNEEIVLGCFTADKRMDKLFWDTL